MADYASLLRDHVTLKCRCIDRVFLQAYVPKLQSVGQVCTFLRWIKGFKIPSSAAFGKIGQAYVKAIHRFAEEHNIPVVHFKKGENKEEMARPYLEAAAKEGQERVVLIGIAQEKASVWRSWKGKGQETAAHPHMEWGREMAYINPPCEAWARTRRWCWSTVNGATTAHCCTSIPPLAEERPAPI